MSKRLKSKKGQAFIEFIIVLPILFFMIILSLQVFRSVYEAQSKQEIVVQRLHQEIYFRANGGSQPGAVVVGDVSSRIRTGGIPILGTTDPGAQNPISIRAGICRDLQCGGSP